MQIAVLGIKGDLDVREKAFKHLLQTCEKLAQRVPIVLLLTCHRFEIYFTFLKTDQTLEFLLTLVKQSGLEKHSYLYLKKECFVHLCKAASGLDSIMIGESEIQRQVKKAYQQYRKKLPFALHYLFQKSLMVSKEIRTRFFTEKKTLKLESYLLDTIVEKVKNPSVLFVGNSEINRNILSYFKSFTNVQLTMCSRFKVQEKIHCLQWIFLDQWIKFDAVICGSKQTGFCIHPKKTVRKVSIFDLSVPRCVDPKIAEDENVYLKNIDEIYEGISSKKETFEKRCHLIIETRIDKLMQIYEKKEKYKQEMQKAAC